MNPIKALRKERGLTQVQLAQELGVDQATVSKWEIGRAYPEAKYALKLSEYFGVTVDYILNNESDERTQKIDFTQGLNKVIDEAVTNAKVTGVPREFWFQLSSFALPRMYYDLLGQYRRNDDFRRMVTIWNKMNVRQQMELLGFAQGILGKGYDDHPVSSPDGELR